MIKKLSLPVKISIAIFPLFFAAVGVIAYFNYSSTQEQMMSQVQNAATAQANTIKEALVNMMVTNESIDDGYLRKVSSSGDITDIHILFRMDSLHFDESYLEDDVRRSRLIRREVDVWDLNKNFGGEVFHTKTPQWFMTCNKHIHETKQILNLSADKPKFLRSCDEMKALIPFVAEKKCTRCHNVELGSVLGAAVMSVPLEQTARHLEANALQSLYLFGGFFVLSLVLNGFIFRKYITNPLKKIAELTGMIGAGKKIDHEEFEDFSNDEIGKLAGEFDTMRQNLQRIDDDLMKNARMSAAGSIAGTLVDDFRIPMNSLSQTADFLKNNQAIGPEERAKKFEQFQNALRRMDDLVQELVDFSAKGFELNYSQSTAEEIAKLLQRDNDEHFNETNIRFAVSCHSTSTLMVDKDRLRRALNKLIDNSEDALANGGIISVLITNHEGSLKITVEDTGAGIPEEIRDTIFEPFVSGGKKKGAGLGLTIAKRTVELHGGTISFSSTTGKGTEFIIIIPRSPSL